MIHYLKQKYKNVEGKTAFHAWCGVDYPYDQGSRPLGEPIPMQFTYNISNVDCEECMEEAALEELSKIP